MIKEFKLVRVDCDYCSEYYPSTKDPIHFQNKEDANKTVQENGWTITGIQHICSDCVKRICIQPKRMWFSTKI